MSDRFKFRAWDKFNDCMWYQKDSIGLFFTNMEELEKGGNGIELMQFTGISDSFGTPIFECDIYEYRYEYDADYDGDIPIVKESSGRKSVRDIFDTWRIKEALSEGGTVKVIGNIHQHRHLLE